MNKYQKGFTPIVIALIVVILAGAGGTGYYLINKNNQNQQQENKKQVDNDTSEWKIYINQDLSFSFDYPTGIAGEISYTKNKSPSFDGCDKSPLLYLVDSCTTSMVNFNYVYVNPPFADSMLSEAPFCSANFSIHVMEKPSSLSLEKIKDNLKMGEYINIDKEKAVRRNEFIGMSPSGGGREDVVYIIKDEKLYVISFSLDREVIGNDYLQACLQPQLSIFNQILSTFNFIKQ
ncbi:MAG: hypothetical protein WC122_01195 [archaeon]